jgi:hypothetical protein
MGFGKQHGVDERAARIPAPPDVAEWASFELARSFDIWLAARGIDYLDLQERAEVDRLRSEWLGRKGGEVDRLRSEWLRMTGGPTPS